MHILIADDSPTDRALIQRLVQKLGFSTVEAVDGADALDKFQLQQPDIVLLDIAMPKFDGLSVCRTLRAQYQAAELPILIITGDEEESSLIRSFDAGASDFLSKPIHSSILEARLHAQVTLLKTHHALIQAYEKLSSNRRMEALGVFAGSIAHHFNNLLGAIASSAELLKLTSEEKSTRALNLILEATKQGSSLTKSLLAFARPDQDQTLSDVGEIIQQAVPLMNVFSDKHVTCRILAHGTIPMVRVSPLMLTQIILELITASTQTILEKGEIAFEILPPTETLSTQRWVTVSMTHRNRDSGVHSRATLLSEKPTISDSERNEILANAAKHLQGQFRGHIDQYSDPSGHTFLLRFEAVD